jgi:ParB family transcriptional regulator, chromosome partitioning protein
LNAPAIRTWTNAVSDEWYTPPSIVDRARRVLGSIDLDPASNAAAQEVVRATTYYTAETDGLSQPWTGRVWMNPPYRRGLVGAFVNRLVDCYVAGEVEAAVTLVNLHRAGSAWFQRLATHGHRCELRRRIIFWGPDGATFRAQHDDAVFYLGPHASRFRRWFGSLGGTLLPSAPLNNVPLKCPCGSPLPVGRRRRFRYCSVACRKRAYRQRNERSST